jgi:glutathione synthase/RimK-type ligase-like ATP-grasp enzyme
VVDSIVLFISDPEGDAHLLPVASELSRRGHGIVIFNPGALPSEAAVIVDGTAAGQRAILAWPDGALDLATVRAAWYRKPDNFRIGPAIAPEQATWLREQWRDLVQGIWAGTEAFWVSEPHAIRYANLKLRQLKLAHELGFRVPDYTVTNDPDRARAFLAKRPHGVIVKALANPAIYGPERVGMVYTHLLTPADAEAVDDVRHEPTFLQEFVRKRMDIRVTIFGEMLFAVAIDSLSTPAAVVDFREAAIMDLPHEPITLPPALEAACRELVRRLGLQYGAIDLLQTPDGDYVFLEINPNGQWYWIEMVTGLPMTQALCDLLERGMGLTPSRPERPPRRAGPVPVGEQVVKLPESLADASAELTATRAWFETRRAEMLLHVGDIEPGDASDERR